MSTKTESDWVDHVQCAACGQPAPIGCSEEGCAACRARYPDSLLQAVSESAEYVLKLRTGEVVYFREATITGDYAHLMHSAPNRGPITWPRQIALDSLALAADPEPIDFPSLDVRVDDIVWCTHLGS